MAQPVTSVLVPAAGSGERMRSAVSKQFLVIQGKPVIIHTLERFQTMSAVREIVVAAQARSFPVLESLIHDFHLTKVRPLVEGGARRQDSVRSALEHSSREAEIVLVHDAVRPFVTHALIGAVIEAAVREGAALAAVPVKDTVKKAGADGRVAETVTRADLWNAQTPQGFKRDLLVRAFEEIDGSAFEATDDAMLVERLGVRPILVAGSHDNVKITTPEDLDIADVIARRFRP